MPLLTRPSVVPPSGSAPSFELSFRPGIELIATVRRFVEDFYEKVIPTSDAAHRLALATHELLENAAKYSADGEAVLVVQVDPGSGAVSVRTANRATGQHIAKLQRVFAEISAAPNGAEFYAEAMRRTAVKTSGSGGIGLARIWAESEMQLVLSVVDDRVEIHASGQLAAAEVTEKGKSR